MKKPLTKLSLLLLIGMMALLGWSSGCSMTNNDGAEQRDALLADPSAAPARTMKDYSVEDIYVECNKTFAISMDYLSELNDTGSFPDETDKTPMCFIRCFLQKGGIVTEDDKVNKEQAIALGWVKNGETIDDCLQEMSKCCSAVILQSDVSDIDNFGTFSVIMHQTLGHSLSFLPQMLDLNHTLYPNIAVGDPCERAYFLMRCVSTRHLVEGRSKDSKKR